MKAALLENGSVLVTLQPESPQHAAFLERIRDRAASPAARTPAVHAHEPPQHYAKVLDSGAVVVNVRPGSPYHAELVQRIEAAAGDVQPAPSAAQQRAGNYAHGHVTVQGLNISIETRAGQRRRPEWPPLAHHYGYIKRTTSAADGDHVDVFLGPNPASELVFVVDQRRRDGSFDEHKVMIGFTNAKEARAGYLANYSPGWKGLGAMRAVPMREFKRWLAEGNTGSPIDGAPLHYAKPHDVSQEARDDAGKWTTGGSVQGGASRGKFILEEAAKIEVTDETPVAREEIGPRDYRSIELRMDSEQRGEMEAYLERAKDAFIDDRMEDFTPDVDWFQIAGELNLDRHSIEEKAAEIFKRYDLEEPSVSRRNYGEEAIQELIDDLGDDAPDELKTELEEWKEEAIEAIEESKEQADAYYTDERREALGDNYDDGEDKREYLREFYQDNEELFSGGDDLELGKWYEERNGDGVLKFATPSGKEYEINAAYRSIPGLAKKVPDLRFNDPSGSYMVTGGGEAFQVFAKVVPAMVAYIQKNDLDGATFSAAEPSRQRLYDRLVKTVAKVLPDYFAASTDKANGRYYAIGKTSMKKELLEGAKSFLGEQPHLYARNPDPAPAPDEWQDVEPEIDPAWFTPEGWPDLDVPPATPPPPEGMAPAFAALFGRGKAPNVPRHYTKRDPGVIESPVSPGPEWMLDHVGPRNGKYWKLAPKAAPAAPPVSLHRAILDQLDAGVNLVEDLHGALSGHTPAEINAALAELAGTGHVKSHSPRFGGEKHYPSGKAWAEPGAAPPAAIAAPDVARSTELNFPADSNRPSKANRERAMEVINAWRSKAGAVNDAANGSERLHDRTGTHYVGVVMGANKYTTAKTNADLHKFVAEAIHAFTSDVKKMSAGRNIDPSLLADFPGAMPAPAPVVPRAGIHTVPLASLHVDPERFQYKIHVSKDTGTTDELKAVMKYRPEFSGVILAWTDPDDGKDYVVNGHHRYELAKRYGETDMGAYFITAPDAKAARAIGALANIAGGNGTAVDAAKFMRDTGMDVDGIEREGVSLKGAIARDAVVLARLSDSLFRKVTLEQMRVPRALAIAGELPGHNEQNQLAAYIDRLDARGKRVTDDVAAEMATEMAATPSTETTTTDLFGTATEEHNVFFERNQLKSYIRDQLAREAGAFAAVSTEGKAETLRRGHNVIDAAGNKAIAVESRRHKNLFDTMANLKGGVSDTVNTFALELFENPKKKGDIQKRLMEAVRASLTTMAA